MQNLLGLQSVKKVYNKLKTQAHTPHAFLFYGAKGSGKTTVALEFAQLFLQKVNLLPITTIDLLWIQPSAQSQWIRLNNIIPTQNKEQIQTSLQEFLSTTPLISNYKVIVIDEAHRLTSEAAHATLKILEEPPSFAKILLTTSRFHEVLPTIISRCINICCEFPSQNEQNEKWGKPSPEEIIFSNGTPGRRTQIHQFNTLYQKLHEILSTTLNSSSPLNLKLAETFRTWVELYAKQTHASSRQAQLESLECLALWFKHLKEYEKVQKVCETHRYILSNAQFTYLTDTLFIQLFNK